MQIGARKVTSGFHLITSPTLVSPAISGQRSGLLNEEDSYYSRVEMAKAAKENPHQHHIIIIRDPDEANVWDSYNHDRLYRKMICMAAEEGMANAKSFVVLEFHDFWKLIPGVQLVTKDDVQKALDFAKDKEEIIVACAAGISRSSATAYIIARSEASKDEAMTILNKEVHWPNRLVLEYGERILGLPLVDEINNAGFDRKST